MSTGCILNSQAGEDEGRQAGKQAGRQADRARQPPVLMSSQNEGVIRTQSLVHLGAATKDL
jgi:hypothetical protein